MQHIIHLHPHIRLESHLVVDTAVYTANAQVIVYQTTTAKHHQCDEYADSLFQFLLVARLSGNPRRDAG